MSAFLLPDTGGNIYLIGLADLDWMCALKIQGSGGAVSGREIDATRLCHGAKASSPSVVLPASVLTPAIEREGWYQGTQTQLDQSKVPVV